MKVALLSAVALYLAGHAAAVPQLSRRDGKFAEGLPISKDGKGGPIDGKSRNFQHTHIPYSITAH